MPSKHKHDDFNFNYCCFNFHHQCMSLKLRQDYSMRVHTILVEFPHGIINSCLLCDHRWGKKKAKVNNVEVCHCNEIRKFHHNTRFMDQNNRNGTHCCFSFSFSPFSPLYLSTQWYNNKRKGGWVNLRYLCCIYAFTVTIIAVNVLSIECFWFQVTTLSCFWNIIFFCFGSDVTCSGFWMSPTWVFCEDRTFTFSCFLVGNNVTQHGKQCLLTSMFCIVLLLSRNLCHKALLRRHECFNAMFLCYFMQLVLDVSFAILSWFPIFIEHGSFSKVVLSRA